MEWLSLLFIALFYLAIFFCGLWIARKKKVFFGKPDHGELQGDQEAAPQVASEDLILAGRNLGLLVGICTLVATEVGGAFLNGTAEEVYNRGALWCLAPAGYALSMTINGLFFVGKLREKNCVTLIDVLQQAYGRTVGGLTYLPSCVGDLCWTAAVLSALGSTLQVLLGVDRTLSVTVSAAFAVAYTLAGGMYAVAYTDVVQLAFVFLGLWLALPFVAAGAVAGPQSGPPGGGPAAWLGAVTAQSWVGYADTLLMIVGGGLPWQPYYQRALSVRTTAQARLLSVSATVLCLVCMAPPVFIGAAAKGVDWAGSTDYPQVANNTSLVLPAMLAQFTPKWVGLVSLAAISAAVMSSVDSSLLAGASYVAHNLYRGMWRGKGSGSDADTDTDRRSVVLVLRSSVLVLGFLATLLSLSSPTIYGLWVLAGDLGYAVVFPQFAAAVHLEGRVNAAGSVAASLVGAGLRAALGEPLVGLPALWAAPVHDDGSPRLPVKTMIMLASLSTLLAASRASDWLRRRRAGQLTGG